MVCVRVPATTANLGAGFDCLAMALGLYNVIELEESDRFAISVAGQGANELPISTSNLAYRTVRQFYRYIGQSEPILRFTLTNDVPLSRGLGSSATAVVGALVAANALNGFPLDYSALLRLATEMEGHPDNVAAALHGGLVVATGAGNSIECVKMPVPTEIKAIVYVPDFAMPTRQARAVLPATVSREDAVFNVGRAALFVAAISTGRLELLRTATQDRLHQPYRRQIFPSMERFFDRALQAGALGVFLSGAGSTLMALVRDENGDVAEAFADVAAQEGIAGSVAELSLNNQGAEIVSDSK